MSFVVTFHVPMFFFISAFLAYKGLEVWTNKLVLQSIRSKIVQLIIPTFFFFSLYKLCHAESPLDFFGMGPGGYWFTVVLFEFFIAYYIITLLAHHIKQTHVFDLFLIGLALLLQAISIVAYRDDNVWRMFQLYNFNFYFLFFALGLLCRRHYDKFSRLIGNTHVCAVVILLFIAGFYVDYNHLLKSPHLSYANYLMTKILAVLMIFAFFQSKARYFDSNTITSSTLSFVGRRTLDIYLVHWFFIPQLSQFKELIQPSSMVLFQIIIPALIAAGIIALCLLCSELIRTSNVLAHYILGVKRQ